MINEFKVVLLEELANNIISNGGSCKYHNDGEVFTMFFSLHMDKEGVTTQENVRVGYIGKDNFIKGLLDNKLTDSPNTTEALSLVINDNVFSTEPVDPVKQLATVIEYLDKHIAILGKCDKVKQAREQILLAITPKANDNIVEFKVNVA